MTGCESRESARPPLHLTAAVSDPSAGGGATPTPSSPMIGSPQWSSGIDFVHA